MFMTGKPYLFNLKAKNKTYQEAHGRALTGKLSTSTLAPSGCLSHRLYLVTNQETGHALDFATKLTPFVSFVCYEQKQR